MFVKTCNHLSWTNIEMIASCARFDSVRLELFSKFGIIIRGFAGFLTMGDPQWPWLYLFPVQWCFWMMFFMSFWGCYMLLWLRKSKGISRWPNTRPWMVIHHDPSPKTGSSNLGLRFLSVFLERHLALGDLRWPKRDLLRKKDTWSCFC